MFRLSISTALLVFVVIAILLAPISNRISAQKRLIDRLGGRTAANRAVIYDFQVEYTRRSSSRQEPPRSPTERLPQFLVDLLGEDLFVSIVVIHLWWVEAPVDESLVQAICDLKSLKFIHIGFDLISESQFDRIRQAHPRIEVLGGTPKDEVHDED